MSTGTDLVTAPIHKQLASIAHGGIPSLIPQTIDEVWRFSQLLANSGLTPKGIDSPEKVTVQILMGFDLGLKPMQAVQNIAVINGKPSIGGDLALAVLMTSGLLADHDEWIEGEGDQRVGICKVERKGMKPIERRFSVSDAVKAGLWQTQPMIRKSYYDKNLKQRVQSKFEEPNDSPWYKYQDRMLCMRARGFAFRDRFSDVLKGMHLTEEMLGHEEEGVPQSQISGPSAPPPPPAVESPPQEPAPPANKNAGPAAPPAEVEEAEIVDAPSPQPKRATGGMDLPQEETELLVKAGVLKSEETQHPPLAQEDPLDPEAWLAEVKDRFDEARSPGDVDGVHEVFGDTANELGMTERQRYQDMHEAAVLRTAAQGKPEQAEQTGEPGPAPDEAEGKDQAEDDEDDEDDIPSADQAAAPPAPSPGDAYYWRITDAVTDSIRTYESIAGLWKATKPERDELIANGHLSRERMKEMQASIKERYAKEFGDPAGQAQAAAPAGPGPSAPPAEEDEVTAYDRSFRARVEACQTIEEIGNLSAGTLAERAKFAGNPLQAEWKALVADRRKQISGIA